MSLQAFFRRLRLRYWADRLLIWAAAAVTGLAVVAFVKLTDIAHEWFLAARETSVLLPLLLTPAGGAAVVWLTRRYAAGAAGSGIPQVVAALNPDLPEAGRGHLVSLRLAAQKMLLGASALLVGFSSGREGPSVQIAAGVMQSCHRFVTYKSHIHQRDLLLAGGAAGIAAAFNAPLAGIVFAIEELSKRFEQRSSGLLITAIVLAGLVAISIMGNLSYFGRISVSVAPSAIIWPALLVTLAASLLGGLFSRLLLLSFSNRSGVLGQFRGRFPVRFAAGCGLAVALLGLISGGAAHGSGYLVTQNLLSGGDDVSVFYFAVKFVSTWLSFWSGIPGGIFAPALAIGAGIGHDVALLTGAASPALIALGMAGFLAAVTQAPITSFIIVMEMTEGHAMVLSLMAAALTASFLSRLISEPLYPALARQQFVRVEGLLAQSR
jgi:H+/Cl- antiporter ClcA